MGTGSFIWNFTKKFVTFGLISVTVNDRYVSVVPVRGGSMSPTFNPSMGKTYGKILAERIILFLQMQIFLV